MQTVYVVQSSSDPNVRYDVTLDPDSCECKGFENRLTCKHVDGVKANPSKFDKKADVTARPLPMLAKPLVKEIRFDRVAVEEKFDGHRVMVRIQDHEVTAAWSRTGKDKKLHKTLRAELALLPSGLYDGELVPEGGGHSYAVARLENEDTLHIQLFDVIEILGIDITTRQYIERRKVLQKATEHIIGIPAVYVHLPPTFDVSSKFAFNGVLEHIWEQGGEGVIIKRLDAIYSPGKRTDAFIKVKNSNSAVLTIIGWEAGTTGPYCVAVLGNGEGPDTRVKVLDDETRRRVNADPTSFLGKQLRIEYHERTPDGNFRHPRWDRLEEE